MGTLDLQPVGQSAGGPVLPLVSGGGGRLAGLSP